MGLVQDALVRMFEELCAVMNRDPWETTPAQLTGMIDREMQELHARYAADNEKFGKKDAEGRSDAGIARPAPARSQSSHSDTDEYDTNANVHMYGFANWFTQNREELCRILLERGLTETDLLIRNVRNHPTNMMSALARPTPDMEKLRMDLIALRDDVLVMEGSQARMTCRAIDNIIAQYWGS